MLTQKRKRERESGLYTHLDKKRKLTDEKLLFKDFQKNPPFTELSLVF